MRLSKIWNSRKNF